MKPFRFCHKCWLIVGTLPALLAGWLRIWQQALKINSAGERRLWGCGRPFSYLHIPDKCSYWKQKPAATICTPIYLSVLKCRHRIHQQQGACQRRIGCRVLLDLSSTNMNRDPCSLWHCSFFFFFFSSHLITHFQHIFVLICLASHEEPVRQLACSDFKSEI